MGIYGYAKSLLKRDKKFNIAYILSIMSTVIVVFNAVNISFDEKLGKVSPVSLLYLVATSIIFSFFCNAYFITRKGEEIGIAILSGASILDIGRFMLIQNMILFFGGSLLGILAAIIVSPLFNIALYAFAGASGSVLHLSLEALGITGAILLLQAITLALVNMGTGYRTEVVNLLKSDKKTQFKGKPKSKLRVSLYLIQYLFPIIIIPIAIYNYNLIKFTSFFLLIGAIGTYGMYNYYFPDKVEKIKAKGVLGDKDKLLIISNTADSISKSSVLFLGLTIANMIFVTPLVTTKVTFEDVMMPEALKNILITNLTAVTLFCIIAIYVIVSLSMLYKIIVETQNRWAIYRQMNVLGYQKEEILKIVDKEMNLFFLIGYTLPLGHVILTLISGLILNSIEVYIAVWVLIFIIVPVAIVALIMKIIVKKMVKKTLDTRVKYE